jgi:hypothetical protein
MAMQNDPHGENPIKKALRPLRHCERSKKKTQSFFPYTSSLSSSRELLSEATCYRNSLTKIEKSL